MGTGTDKTQDAEYDVYGNLTKLTTQSIALTLGTSTATNRLTASNYDAAGSMTSWNGNAYDYEPLGMTRQVVSSSIEYDHIYTADDERLWTFSPGNPSRFTVRDLDGKVLREFKLSGSTWTVERDYVYRDGTLLAAVLPTGAVNHFHPDHLGTPRLITGAGGAVVAYHLYHPYGTEATAFNQDSERMKFTAHERDLGSALSAADDLDYMHARNYNMQIGRFMAFDPVGGNPYIPQSWNRFAYVLDNPLKYIDPTGLFGIGFAAAIFTSRPTFYDEITVFASGGSTSTTGSPGLVTDQAAFRSFLFGGHAGGSAFNEVRDPRSLGLSVRDYAHQVAAAGGAGSCEEYTCRVMENVSDATLTGTLYLEKGVVAVTSMWLFSGAGGLSMLGNSAGSFSLFGATDDGFRFWASARSRGGGVHHLKNGKSTFGIDWHRFKLQGKMVNRPHYHRGATGSQYKKHRPWQGGSR